MEAKTKGDAKALERIIMMKTLAEMLEEKQQGRLFQAMSNN